MPMLPDYQNMTTSNLVDLLAQETEKFTQLMMDKKFGNEYEDCKQVIHQLQALITLRIDTPGLDRDIVQRELMPVLPGTVQLPGSGS
jgi:hypothetical protein